jgi:hypothetical protein
VVVAVGLVYLTAQLGTGMLIALISPSTVAATATTVIIWLFTALISVPAVAFVGRAMLPTPSEMRVEGEREAMYQTLMQSTEQELGQQLRRAIGDDAPIRGLRFDGPPGDRVRTAWLAQAQSIQTAIDDFDQRTRQASRRQHRLTHALALISGGPLFLDAAADIFDTGSSTLARWRGATERFHRQLRPTLFFEGRPWIHLRVPTPRGESLLVFEHQPPIPRRTLPRFEPPTEPVGTRVAAARGSILALIAHCGILCGGALIAATRRRLETATT